jgi:hypothetical protein
MSGLADLLADVADEAKVYGNTEQAVRVLRRRHRVARLTPLVLAVVVVAAVSVTYVAVHRGSGQMTPSAVVSWLPSRLLPDPGAPPLPTDRGVGPGSLVYVGRDEQRAVLVTVDLGQYGLRVDPDSALSISPDGRWLLSVVDGRATLRDLTGTTVKSLFALPGGSAELAWSANLLAIRPVSSSDQVTVVDLDSLASHRISMTDELCGARNDGKLLGCSPSGAPISVTLMDAATGDPRPTVAADLTSALTPIEQMGANIARVFGAGMVSANDGEVVAVRTTPYHAEAGVVTPGDLLVFDVATGRFLRRISLPPTETGATVPQSGGVAFLATEQREVQAGPTDGVTLIHTVPIGPADPHGSKVIGVEFVDPSTGARLEVMTVTGTVTRLVVRGGTNP